MSETGVKDQILEQKKMFLMFFLNHFRNNKGFRISVPGTRDRYICTHRVLYNYQLVFFLKNKDIWIRQLERKLNS